MVCLMPSGGLAGRRGREGACSVWPLFFLGAGGDYYPTPNVGHADGAGGGGGAFRPCLSWSAMAGFCSSWTGADGTERSVCVFVLFMLPLERNRNVGNFVIGRGARLD